MKKTLCLSLAVMMIVGIFAAVPFSAGAVTVIHNVTIAGVTAPVSEAHPIEYATVSEGLVLDDFAWYNKTEDCWMNTNDVFKDGNIYEAKAYIQAADGYKIATAGDMPDVAVTINGRVAKVNKVSGLTADVAFVATIAYGEYSVSFNSNGGSGKMAADFEQNGGYILPECEFEAPNGMKFKAWASGAPDGTQYDAGFEFDVTEDAVFYAVWESAASGHEHLWGDWMITQKATPDEDGVETRKCLIDPSHIGTRSFAKISNIKMNKFKFKYNGKNQKPTFTIADANGKKLKDGTDYTVHYPKSSKNVGLYLVSVEFKGNRYEGLYDADFSIAPANNPMTVKAVKKTVKLSSLKKKNITVSALSVKNAQGAKSFKKTSGSKKITVNKKTGKITLKKGMKKGTYSLKVKVTAKGTKNYNAGSKTVRVKVSVSKK